MIRYIKSHKISLDFILQLSILSKDQEIRLEALQFCQLSILDLKMKFEGTIVSFRNFPKIYCRYSILFYGTVASDIYKCLLFNIGPTAPS